jgi:hypothetical protein
MAIIETLLGKRYSDLQRFPYFADITIPPRELIGDQSYVNLPTQGISLVLPDHESVQAVQLHSQGHEGYSGYRGDIPENLSFHMKRSDVRDRLGTPESSGEAREVILLGVKQAWDSFVCGDRRIHVEYLADAIGIQLITITPV